MNLEINLIRQNNGFKPNKREDSFYRTYTIQNNRPIQVRISNHGTHLWTWYDKEYDPSYAINICVVFSKDGSHSSDTTVDTRIKDEQGNVIGERKPFEVKQFVYNCQILDENDAGLINAEIQNTWNKGGFNDPLAGTPKHANVVLLKTNQDTDNDNTDIKTENIMRNKRTYRLTESRLRGMIREAVKGALTEGETTEIMSNPFSNPHSDEPQNDRINTKQLKVLDNIVDTIAGIANNTSENTDLLFDAMNSIEKFVEAHTNVGPFEDDPYYFGN